MEAIALFDQLRFVGGGVPSVSRFCVVLVEQNVHLRIAWVLNGKRKWEKDRPFNEVVTSVTSHKAFDIRYLHGQA